MAAHFFNEHKNQFVKAKFTATEEGKELLDFIHVQQTEIKKLKDLRLTIDKPDEVGSKNGPDRLERIAAERSKQEEQDPFAFPGTQDPSQRTSVKKVRGRGRGKK